MKRKKNRKIKKGERSKRRTGRKREKKKKKEVQTVIQKAKDFLFLQQCQAMRHTKKKVYKRPPPTSKISFSSSFSSKPQPYKVAVT